MSRKHFEAIADTIRRLSVSDDVRAYVAEETADTLAGFNPRFDRARFLSACGV